MIKKFLRTKLPSLWKIYKINTSNEEIKNISKEDKKVFIFLAADYPNLGDIAITYAQKEFLKECYPQYKIIEVPADKTITLLKFVKKITNKNDIITTVGGGNMGNIYEYYEDLRRTVINNFKDNYIISFPQTIDFSNDAQGKKSLNKTIKTIKKHKNILIYAREEKSYKKMKELFGEEKVKLSPDIVLSLKNKIDINQDEKDKIGICFRNDKEEDLTKLKIKEEILNLTQNDDKIIFDTVLTRKDFIYEDRYKLLFKTLEEIANFKTIYTNRLHAMIFAYLVGTRCYFVDNTNKKISETYKKWLSNIEYIKEYNVEQKECNKELNLDKAFGKMKKEIIEGDKNG